MAKQTYNVLVNDVLVADAILSYDYAEGICRGIHLCTSNLRTFGDLVKIELETVTWRGFKPISSERKVML